MEYPLFEGIEKTQMNEIHGNQTPHTDVDYPQNKRWQKMKTFDRRQRRYPKTGRYLKRRYLKTRTGLGKRFLSLIRGLVLGHSKM